MKSCRNINSAFFCSALSTCISVLSVKINSFRTVTTHYFFIRLCVMFAVLKHTCDSNSRTNNSNKANGLC